MILVGRITREVNEICFTAPIVHSNVIVIVVDFGHEMIYVVVMSLGKLSWLSTERLLELLGIVDFFNRIIIFVDL